MANLLEAEEDQIEHGSELGEDQGLGRRVAGEHAVQLLAQRLDLGAALEVGQRHPVQDRSLARPRHPRQCL